MFKLKIISGIAQVIGIFTLAILTATTLCEFILKPLWHIILKGN